VKGIVGCVSFSAFAGGGVDDIFQVKVAQKDEGCCQSVYVDCERAGGFEFWLCFRDDVNLWWVQYDYPSC
jgi:hypothetical protein